MKRTRILLALAAIFAVASCTKITEPANEFVTERWQWVSSSGGIAGVTIFPAENQVRILEIRNNMQYRVSENGQTSAEGTYTLVTVRDITTNRDTTAVVFYDASLKPSLPQVIGNREGNLVLAENVVDGFTHVYKAVD